MPRSIPRSDPEYEGPAVLSEQGQCSWITDISDSDGRMVYGEESVDNSSGGSCHHDRGDAVEAAGW